MDKHDFPKQDITPGKLDLPAQSLSSANKFGITLDAAKHDDPDTTISAVIERSIDGGKTWECAGRLTRSGGLISGGPSGTTPCQIALSVSVKQDLLLRSRIDVIGKTVELSGSVWWS